ncbi:hypothetical protein H4582DRAFT_205026 [Lactarius indigo]|nr:hypothetical protein H4582DRAFT_205026 [Lactarius indigo]
MWSHDRRFVVVGIFVRFLPTVLSSGLRNALLTTFFFSSPDIAARWCRPWCLVAMCCSASLQVFLCCSDWLSVKFPLYLWRMEVWYRRVTYIGPFLDVRRVLVRVSISFPFHGW